MPPFKGPPSSAQLAGRKAVLSNKSLTRRVRALGGTEGKRITDTQNLYNNVTLTAGTAEIKYTGQVNILRNQLLHKMRVWVNIKSVTDSTTRIILLEDTQLKATDLLVAGILASPADPWSSYKDGSIDIHPFGAKRLNKNLPDIYRARVLKDMLFSHVIGSESEVKAIKFDINFSGRKLSDNYGWLFLILSNGANVVDLQYLVDITDLD